MEQTAIVTLGLDGSCEPGSGWESWPGQIRFPGRIFYLPEEMRFHIELDREQYGCIYTPMLTQRIFNFCVINRMRKSRLLLLHGALLGVPEAAEAGIALFGESGIGKSTASERFRRQGGRIFADDKMLLYFDHDGVRAQPSPTWSSWLATSAPGIVNQTGVCVKLAGLFRLSRGGDDRVAECPAPEWRRALLAGAGNFMLNPVGYLPTALIADVMRQNMGLLTELERKFGYFQVLGDLNGSLYRNLSDFIYGSRG